MYPVIAKHVLQRLILLVMMCVFVGKSWAQLVADFSATRVTGCAPLLVNFTDLSKGNPTAWKWDLGNGTISFLKNPSGTYFSSGRYTISLIVLNDNSEDTIIRDQYITVLSAPQVNFISSTTGGCLPLLVKFTDQSSTANGTLKTWKWDFGDGYIDSIQNPQHTYTLAGPHDVTLQVTSSSGCTGSNSKEKFIDIPAIVKADFSNTLQNLCDPPVIMNFKNLSIGPTFSTYKWDFGDGTVSTLANPSHQYSSAGSYTVQLVTISPGGCTDTIQKTVIGKIKADFINPVTLCRGKAFVFTNTSTPSPFSVSWDFGDSTSSNLFEPAKTYYIPGDYTVKMIADFGDCKDSISQIITVPPVLDISFTSDVTGSCKAPFTVNFTSKVSGLITYNWNFGDSTYSTEANPSHTYTRIGYFDVTLTTGCGDVSKVAKYIKIRPTTLILAALPIDSCAPFTYTFRSKINTFDSIKSYSWDFGDGSKSNAETPTHTFTTTGSYTISLTVTTSRGCSASATVVNGVNLGSKPIPNFSAATRVACAQSSIQFNDLSIGDVNKWIWYFGDGDTSHAQNPKHTYKDTGYFTVTLVARSNGCPAEISLADYIYIKAPIARFTIKNDCSNPKLKAFSDASTGADTWDWNFGDGKTSTVKDPVHSYTNSGTYIVTLRVTNISTGCDFITSKQVQVILLKTDFTSGDINICKGTLAQFQVINSKPQIVSYNWIFGDGSSLTYKTDTIPAGYLFSHKYTRVGDYNVQLITKDSIGCKDTVLKPLYIKVSVPTVNFTSSKPGNCLNTSTNFIDNSFSNGSHSITQWIWTYGDSTTQTLSSPPFRHTYKQTGNYTVKLQVIEDNGCTDSLTRQDYIVISKPVADFISEDTISCPAGSITFKNLSTGPGLKSFWNFGDGTTSDSTNPVHKYSAPGIFTVSLNITDQNGCTATMKRLKYISIANAVADFSMSDSASTCPPFFVSFNNTSVNDSALLWDFGDGNFSTVRDPIHSYYLPGTYKVKLRIMGHGGCTVDKSRQIIIKGPKGTFTYTNLKGCNPLQSSFKASTTNNISFVWDFNDGNIVTTTDSVITHKYINPGTYSPKMILVDENGCQVPITGTDSISVFGINANITNSKTQLCDSGYVSFKDNSTSNDVIASYLWNFGDGTTSNQKDPVHSFKRSGAYTTKFVVATQAGCKDSVYSSLPVKVIKSPMIDIIGAGGKCIPATFSLSGRLLIADTSVLTWRWNLGNGNISTQQNPPSQVFTVPVKIVVQSIATNSSGCSDTATKIIEGYALPQVIANADAWICEGKTLNLSVTGAASYNWSPSTGLSCTNCANPVTRTNIAMEYIVKGTSINGCVSSDTVSVSVQRPFNITVSEATNLCVGSATMLKAEGSDNYIWSPATGLDDPAIATPVARPVITTNYRVIGSDDHGCFKDTGYVLLKVSPVPTVKAGDDKTINVGETIDLVPQLSDDVTNVNWSPTSGVFRNSYPGIAVRPVESTEYTVEVNNAGGCRARDKVTVYVICNNANIFMPNTFTPNGDGTNDVFFPRGSGVFSIKLLKIFNRWGEVVFEKGNINSNDASAGWDGTFKGKKLESNVFIYMMNVVCDNNSVITFKGNVALMR